MASGQRTARRFHSTFRDFALCRESLSARATPCRRPCGHPRPHAVGLRPSHGSPARIPAAGGGQSAALGARSHRLVPGVLVPSPCGRRPDRRAHAVAHRRRRRALEFGQGPARRPLGPAAARLGRRACLSRGGARRHAGGARRGERARRPVLRRTRVAARGHARRGAADDAADPRAADAAGAGGCSGTGRRPGGRHGGPRVRRRSLRPGLVTGQTPNDASSGTTSAGRIR